MIGCLAACAGPGCAGRAVKAEPGAGPGRGGAQRSRLDPVRLDSAVAHYTHYSRCARRWYPYRGRPASGATTRRAVKFAVVYVLADPGVLPS